MNKMNIYTLRHPFPESDEVHSLLNGKIFSIWVSSSNEMTFYDGNNTGPVVYSTAIDSKVETDDGVIITTVTGTTYDLIDVLTLIPTKIGGSSEGTTADLAEVEGGVPTVVDARIVSPKRWGDMAEVRADMSDGTKDVLLFQFFDDELSFSPSEFTGLTKEQADDLKVQRDKQYLRS